MKKTVFLIPILLAGLMFFGCNIDGDTVLLVNETKYTVLLEYLDGTEADGSNHFEIATVPPFTEVELTNVQTTSGSSGVQEFKITGHWTEEGVDVHREDTPGTVFTPLTLTFTE